MIFQPPQRLKFELAVDNVIGHSSQGCLLPIYIYIYI